MTTITEADSMRALVQETAATVRLAEKFLDSIHADPVRSSSIPPEARHSSAPPEEEERAENPPSVH